MLAPDAVRHRSVGRSRQALTRCSWPSTMVSCLRGHGWPRSWLSGCGAEDYAVLGAEVVVERHRESYVVKPSARAWAITQRAERARRLTNQRVGRHTDCTTRARTSQPILPAEEERRWPMGADPSHPDSARGREAFRRPVAGELNRLSRPRPSQMAFLPELAERSPSSKAIGPPVTDELTWGLPLLTRLLASRFSAFLLANMEIASGHVATLQGHIPVD
jgi:hypothetical protein